ncbi:hypothetical protein GQ53DRAFT_817984 [Thozetella sp. PMI_491]|nr:hypothetical protein GQ53DRAFT_817984 [Thozetella sp. PMI_491]
MPFTGPMRGGKIGVVVSIGSTGPGGGNPPDGLNYTTLRQMMTISNTVLRRFEQSQLGSDLIKSNVYFRLLDARPTEKRPKPAILDEGVDRPLAQHVLIGDRYVPLDCSDAFIMPSNETILREKLAGTFNARLELRWQRNEYQRPSWAPKDMDSYDEEGLLGGQDNTRTQTVEDMDSDYEFCPIDGCGLAILSDEMDSHIEMHSNAAQSKEKPARITRAAFGPITRITYYTPEKETDTTSSSSESWDFSVKEEEGHASPEIPETKEQDEKVMPETGQEGPLASREEAQDSKSFESSTGKEKEYAGREQDPPRKYVVVTAPSSDSDSDRELSHEEIDGKGKKTVTEAEILDFKVRLAQRFDRHLGDLKGGPTDDIVAYSPSFHPDRRKAEEQQLQQQAVEGLKISEEAELEMTKIRECAAVLLRQKELRNMQPS